MRTEAGLEHLCSSARRPAVRRRADEAHGCARQSRWASQPQHPSPREWGHLVAPGISVGIRAVLGSFGGATAGSFSGGGGVIWWRGSGVIWWRSLAVDKRGHLVALGLSISSMRRHRMHPEFLGSFGGESGYLRGAAGIIWWRLWGHSVAPARAGTPLDPSRRKGCASTILPPPVVLPVVHLFKYPVLKVTTEQIGTVSRCWPEVIFRFAAVLEVETKSEKRHGPIVPTRGAAHESGPSSN